MRIDLSSIDREQFSVKEGVFCGIPAMLVTPALQGTQWTQANKHLRSSIWSLDGELLSGSFPKFTNAGENPEHFPMPDSVADTIFVEKLDGSCGVFDWVNGQLSVRTRGTFSYETLENADDFRFCIARYPRIGEWLKEHPHVTLLTEVTTPNQRIVLDYGPEPDMVLIGGVVKDDYVLLPQSTLDHLAISLNMRRPRRFTFASISHALNDIKAWEGMEGCVMYHPLGLHKLKADSYLRRHRFKERVTVPNLLDLFFDYGRPDVLAFLARIESEFDYECREQAYALVRLITDTYTRVTSRYNLMEVVVGPLRSLPRRDAAMTIQATYTDVWKGAAFHFLDNRPLDDKTVRKLMEYVLEHSDSA